ncbi:MAG: N-acetyltransferase [Alphaproteobacteria bacterium]|jgi:L-amino acid N-acyltransferase YncA|nr:N-acetyltransferase [Alphaproteobacteria bacterium]
MSSETDAPEILIRDATEGDMAALQDIYAHHVLEGLASFEEIPPDNAEMTRRWNALLGAGYPYRVAVVGGVIQGYSYAGPFRPRPAYRHTVENSVYVSLGSHRQGVGRRLLEDLIAQCSALGYRQMVAIIGDSANHASIGLHASLGFEKTGVQPSVGLKFGRWVDSVIMQRALGEGDTSLPDSGTPQP